MLSFVLDKISSFFLSLYSNDMAPKSRNLKNFSAFFPPFWKKKSVSLAFVEISQKFLQIQNPLSKRVSLSTSKRSQLEYQVPGLLYSLYSTDMIQLFIFQRIFYKYYKYKNIRPTKNNWQSMSIFYIRVDEEHQNFYSIILIIGEPDILCSVVCFTNCVASTVLPTYGYHLIGCVFHDPSIVVFAQSTPRFRHWQQKTEKCLVQLFGLNLTLLFWTSFQPGQRDDNEIA